MRAAIYDRTGPAHEVLAIEDVPTPEPGPGEVRVKVRWSGVNPSDVKSRAGVRSKVLPFPRITPHSDGSGIIDAVGAGVPWTRINERVWTWNAAWGRPFGTAAEHVVLPAAQAVRLPDPVDLEAGACLGIPALTAYHAVVVDGGVAGASVLVAGGAGAVGHYAVQMARLLGARQVLATVSGPEKAAVAKAAGADVVLNYKTDDVEAGVRDATGGKGVDRVIEVDYAANAALDHRLLVPGGDITVYGSGAAQVAVPFFPMLQKHIRVRFFVVYSLPQEARERATAHLTVMMQKASLTHAIAARFPLERIADAHVQVEKGLSIGNVVVEVA